MKCTWITVAAVAALCIAELPQPALAAPTTPAAKPASSKVRKKTSAKKSKPRVTRTKNVKKTTAVPRKPAADIPAVTETSSVWRGCAESQDLPMLASGLVMDETRLASLLEEEDVLSSGSSECVPYVAATGGEGGVASAIFQRTEPKAGESPVLAVRKTADGVTASPGECDCPEPTRRVLSIPAKAIADLPDQAMPSIPSSVRWQLGILVPQMIGRLAADSERTVEMAAQAFTVRVAVERHTDSEPEHLQSIEIIDSDTGKRVDGAWWLERPDGPGVFIGMEGLASERLLWQSPVKYFQKSRGVGPAVTTFQRRVAAPKGSGGKSVVRTVKVREYHLGVDLLAPKGMDVHAVGDATVAFAGRNGGYGNLIILDHGRGYQTYYAHLSAIKHGVKVGAKLSRGDVIGLVGSTGRSTAPHLHFETRKDTRYIDPFDETRQLEFWLLTAADQEQLAMQLLASTPALSRENKIASSQERTELTTTDLP